MLLQAPFLDEAQAVAAVVLHVHGVDHRAGNRAAVRHKNARRKIAVQKRRFIQISRVRFPEPEGFHGFRNKTLSLKNLFLDGHAAILPAGRSDST